MAHGDEFEKLMDEVAAGSERAIWTLAENFTPEIVRTVRLSLSPRLRPKFDPQDIAQSLWASLLLKRTDLLRLRTPEQLIAYLARAAKNKVIDKARYYQTQKCDVKREQRLDEGAHSRGSSDERRTAGPLYSRDPTPSKHASFRERLNLTISQATERDKQIFSLRLKGCTFDSIGQQLQIDEKTARRAVHALAEQILK
jgi:RNA polymerase sigma-70 factor (ECF subfamily)